jgi:hypothetical protein
MPGLRSTVLHSQTDTTAHAAPVAVLSPAKNATLALTLNFFLPGAGLWYLGLSAWGLINFLAVLGIGVVAALILPDDVFDQNIRQLCVVCSGASGGLAMALAKQRNEGSRPRT